MADPTIMQGLLESLMQRPQDQQQQKGTMLANLISSPNPLATTVASMLPGQLANVGQAAQGLFGLKAPVSPAQKLQEMITANPALMNTPEGLSQLANMAAASGDRATALRFSVEAATKAQEASVKSAATTKMQLQVGTTLSYLNDLVAGTKNKQAQAELKALLNPVASGAQTPDQAIEAANNVLERYKEAPLEANVTDYQFPNAAVLSLRTNKQGEVFYNNAWVDPGQLGINKAPTKTANTGKVDVTNYDLPNDGGILALRTDDTTGQVFYQGAWVDPGETGLTLSAARSTTSGRSATVPEVSETAVSSLVSRARSMGYLDNNPNSPVTIAFSDAIRNGQVKDAATSEEWLSKMPETPAWNQRQSAIKNNALAAVAPSIRNIQGVNEILNNPASNVGSGWSYIEDYRTGSDAARLKDAIAPIVSDAALRQIGTLKQQAAELGGEGTGLGAISVNEFDALQNSIENMKTGRTKDDLQKAVSDYELHLLNVRNLNSGRPLLLVEGDPVYSGLPFEQGSAPGEIFIILNGIKVPVSLHESVDEALIYNKTR